MSEYKDSAEQIVDDFAKDQQEFEYLSQPERLSEKTPCKEPQLHGRCLFCYH